MDCICCVMAVQMDAATSIMMAPMRANIEATTNVVEDLGMPLYGRELSQKAYGP